MTGTRVISRICLLWKGEVILFLLLGVTHFTSAQDYILFGMVKDSEVRSPLIGAHMTLISEQDSTDRYFVVSDDVGQFEFVKLIAGTYVVETRYLGYLDSRLVVEVNTPKRNIGIIYLIPETRLLDEVQVKSRTPPVIQKGDTVQYSAQAYKTHPDASAQDLIAKMPGFAVKMAPLKHRGKMSRRYW